MTDHTIETPPLGVGAILGETTSLLFRNFLTACGIALIPIGVVTVVSAGLFGIDLATGQGPGPDDLGPDFLVTIGAMYLFQLVGYSIATAMIVSFAYDVKLGRPIRFSTYVSSVISNIFPLIVLSVLFNILIMIGFVLFVIPGFWVYAVFCAVAPVIVIERAGFGALTRSAALTKNYRWPIAGLLFVVTIIVFITTTIASVIASFIAAMISGPILLLFLNIVASTVGFAFACVTIAMLYARLREIKEGVSVDLLADVFS